MEQFREGLDADRRRSGRGQRWGRKPLKLVQEVKGYSPGKCRGDHPLQMGPKEAYLRRGGMAAFNEGPQRSQECSDLVAPDTEGLEGSGDEADACRTVLVVTLLRGLPLLCSDPAGSGSSTNPAGTGRTPDGDITEYFLALFVEDQICPLLKVHIGSL